MRNILLILLLLFSSFPLYAQTFCQSAYELIGRVTPKHQSQFITELIDKPVMKGDIYEIGQKDSKVLLRGSSPVAVAVAYHMYLKYDCNVQLSWFGDQLKLPKRLPLPHETRKGQINGDMRVYFNYCSISYTAPWWDWKRWEREIDYMAMNGINVPLQTIGLDAVWYHTLLKMGFTDDEARSFLVGPAHQAWQWMPNIESVYGPLPLSWIESHKELARKIYRRQLDLGMQPIQQAFTGYVPKLMMKKYPDAHIKQQPEWYGFEGVSMLDPLDPLFDRIRKIFLETQKELFGAYGLYAADPFHESAPPVSGDEYLRSVGTKIWKLIKNFDPTARVAMQSWSIRKPIVDAFPKSDLVILDLAGSKFASLQNFWGYPFVAGNLHNFGGRINMHGDIPLIASNQYKTAEKNAPNIIGNGLFMESVCQNPMYYALAFEMSCHEGTVNIDEWMDKYVTRAYGKYSQSARDAWEMLLNTAYKRGTNGVEFSSMICARPALRAKKSGPNSGFKIPYDPLELYKAQALLLKDAKSLKKSTIYRQDVIDLQRQIMTNLAQKIHFQMADSYEKGDMAKFREDRDVFLNLLLDVDELLATRDEWNFDKWISDARSWGTTDAEKDLLEKDATALVTLWGFTDGYECKQFDYSWREWAGLIRRYYYQRWKMFYDMIENEAENGRKYTGKNVKMSIGREAFRGNEFYDKLADWEINFVNTPKTDINPKPKGDEIVLAKRFFKKYSEIAERYYK
ncbi:alpha-N-acetylglucosaminidase TIM-barrel domain-containing protein [uncultured Mediterranea sp.]|uniref:alpha-N-acetylglucosaminidase n=1 Tax=uncultured Mediterranea sp. TaxID=1926662 RepID=UPI0027D94447|nr:alpha-N-acetylglucosaminidase TIM-barrel domain-containing protein [uncultured Mediterranea sp.]